MTLDDLARPAARAAAVSAAIALAADLFPLCRSITGNGVRETLRRVGRDIPLTVHEVPSATSVFDWDVPNEWNLHDAYVADPSGRRVIDFRASNLHVVGYSHAMRARMALEDLRPHLHTLPAQPALIPYRTSYYRPAWGFCCAHETLERMRPGQYEVVIDATLAPGHLTYAECRIPGRLSEEVVIFTHVCHPSLANDNLSGIVLAAALAQALLESAPRLSYRIVFAPGTIGSITWLARNAEAARTLRAGLVIGLLGGDAPLTYKRSARGDTEIDRIAAHAIGEVEPHARVVPFTPYGYDERQFCSPGFNLPVGRLTRAANGEYPQYHTSGDDLSLLGAASLEGALDALVRIVGTLDASARFIATRPHGEPRLGKHGLYKPLGGTAPTATEEAYLWLLNQSDGTHGLADIGIASGIATDALTAAASALVDAGLLRPLPDSKPMNTAQALAQEPGGSRA